MKRIWSPALYSSSLDPADRFAVVDDDGRDLAAHAGAFGVVARPRRAVPPSSRRRRSRRRALPRGDGQRGRRPFRLRRRCSGHVVASLSCRTIEPASPSGTSRSLRSLTARVGLELISFAARGTARASAPDRTVAGWARRASGGGRWARPRAIRRPPLGREGARARCGARAALCAARRRRPRRRSARRGGRSPRSRGSGRAAGDERAAPAERRQRELRNGAELGATAAQDNVRAGCAPDATTSPPPTCPRASPGSAPSRSRCRR